ncbi:hypothetical protein LCGC14_0394280 [marine sediment metagenome]|uniref:Uncharacterized protein n=1 Tax=marine sediment metagenome TaxID=412755 RepID=A0A0F9W7Q7_9ZZZZ
MKFRDEEFFSKEINKVIDVLDARVKMERSLWAYPNQEHLGAVWHRLESGRVDLYMAAGHQKELEAVTRHLAKVLGIAFESHQYEWENDAMRMVGNLNGVRIEIEGGFLEACQMVEVPELLPAQEALPERVKMRKRLVCPEKPLVIDEVGQWKVKLGGEDS